MRWCSVGLLLFGCGSDAALPQGPEVVGAARHGVTISTPAVLASIDSPQRDANGARVGVPCGTCHEGRAGAHSLPDAGESIAGPHAGLRLRHGMIRCASCHHPERYDAFRLADGRSAALTEAMDLCRQCHGPQARDYDRGAHGGMRGHWDLRRGPRVRNHCVDCHDPHDPAFGSFLPAAPPRDRNPAARRTHDE